MREKRTGMPKAKTPIEQIFIEIVKRKMTPRERNVLLAKPKKARKGN